MAEEEELKLSVTLDDQASSQLRQLQQQLALFGRGGSALEDLTEKVDNLGRALGGLHRDARGLAERAGVFGGVAASLTNQVMAMGQQMLNNATNIRALAESSLEWQRLAYSLGSSTAQIRGLTDQMRLSGISTREAQNALKGMFDKFGEIARIDSETLVGAFNAFPEASLERLDRLNNVLTNGKPFERINEIRRFALERRALITAVAGPIAGAREEQAVYDYYGAPQLSTLRRYLTEVDEERDKFIAKRDEQMAQFYEQNERAAQSMQRTTESLGTIGVLIATPGMEKLARLTERMAEFSERFLGGLFAGIAAADRAAPEPQNWFDFLNPFNKDNIAREKAAREAAQAERNRIYQEQQKSHELDPATTPQRFFGGGGVMDQNTQATLQLTDELKRLSDLFSDVVAGEGELGALTTQMGGLAPGLGGGVGRGAYGRYGFLGGGGGFGGGGGSAPYGSSVGPGTGPGAGSTPAGGPAGGASQTGPTPANLVPGEGTGAWTATTPYDYGKNQTGWYANFDYEAALNTGVDIAPEDIDQSSDTNAKYGEKAIKPGSKSWDRYIDAQIDRIKKGGGKYIEFDNSDYAYQRNPQAVRDAYMKAANAGLSVLLKNPNEAQMRDLGVMKTADGRYVVGGAVFEEGGMRPKQFAASREAIGRPGLQGAFIRYGQQETKSLAQEVEATAGTSLQYANREYYGTSITARGPGAGPAVTPGQTDVKYGGSDHDREVDDYLWGVYERTPKVDSAGNFAWKDPAAAAKAGRSLRDEVIGGMSRELKEGLYQAFKETERRGGTPEMTTGFRGDYRQSLITSGVRAGVGFSRHGGSKATRGYGFGEAADVDPMTQQVINEQGAKYGLHWPNISNDPAHIQTLKRGDALTSGVLPELPNQSTTAPPPAPPPSTEGQRWPRTLPGKSSSGSDMDKAADVEVKANGKTEAEVKAPAGTKVTVEGNGILKDTETKREVTDSGEE